MQDGSSKLSKLLSKRLSGAIPQEEWSQLIAKVSIDGLTKIVFFALRVCTIAGVGDPKFSVSDFQAAGGRRHDQRSLQLTY